MICPCCELPADKILSCAAPGCKFTGCWLCMQFHLAMRHSTDSSVQTSGSSSQRTERRTPNVEVSGSTPDSPTSSNCICTSCICIPAGIHFAGEQAARDNSVNDAPTAHRSPAIHSTYHPQRGGNSNGLHVTQGSAPESDRHPASPETLDRVQERHGCVAQMDMPRNHDERPADESRASAVIHILSSRKPLVREAQSTSNILDVERSESICPYCGGPGGPGVCALCEKDAEDIEADPEDMGGYPDPADNPRFA